VFEVTGDSLIYEGSIEYLKIETISLANVWLANTASWDSPFNSSFLMEAATDPSAANDEKILLEPGGSYLFPTLQFPEAETGTTSIDMSFNSDLLLEDYTTGDLGMESSGYVLDEQSGSAGTGPVRYISLEEDTQGYGHQYESIPFVHTQVVTHLLDSMNSGLLTESGDDIVCEAGLYDQDGMVLLLQTQYHHHFPSTIPNSLNQVNVLLPVYVRMEYFHIDDHNPEYLLQVKCILLALFLRFPIVHQEHIQNSPFPNHQLYNLQEGDHY
jgi:hypothetical protein